ncbi:hypothetical protein J7E99_20700 [Streptomyces sp. ISL-44]|uniref:hypothetical protein n=1 Tax=Streptomyces sp. ISL-44 TaxID=2819184 RepID=UPI001BEBBE36|nr:hypothetical protein [Streptomyces sp. ISL-44]MBT2543061.1 hypothetical protein [Streptomyces sp. ISL-44]
MAYTLDGQVQSSVDLNDYLDHVNATVDPADTDSVLSSAEALRALSGNPDLLVDHLNR